MGNTLELFLRARQIPLRRSRLPFIQTAPRSALSAAERAAYEIVAREVQADLDLDLDPRYRDLLKQVSTRVNASKLRTALYHPERVLESGARYPLYSSEIAELARTLGVETSAKTVDRLVADRLVPSPPSIGTGRLLRSAFFARHLVDVLYEQLFAPRPSVAIAHLEILRGEVGHDVLAYYQGLEGVDRSRLEALAEVKAEPPTEPATFTVRRVMVAEADAPLPARRRRR